MASPYWLKFLINKTFSQRFFYSKLTHNPVIGKLVDYLLFDGDDILILPNDKVIPINYEIDQPESLMAPSQVVEHFIRQAKTRWIMDFCICRDSTHCKDYPVELGCLFLGEAANDINPKFGRPATVEEALEHARKCREAGLVHLIGRNKLDMVWLNVRPGDRLLTICNCCPCCCLWKVLTDISPQIGDKVSRMPGITVRVTGKCIGCGTCTKDVCFVNAIKLEDKQAVINEATCRGCGRCVAVCPNEAIEIIIDNENFVSESIERLEKVVDVT